MVFMEISRVCKECLEIFQGNVKFFLGFLKVVLFLTGFVKENTRISKIF